MIVAARSVGIGSIQAPDFRARNWSVLASNRISLQRVYGIYRGPGAEVSYGFIKRATFQPIDRSQDSGTERLIRNHTARWAKEVERNAKVRRLMRSRTAPNDAGNIYTLDYNIAVARKATGEVAEFSGSSLNRKPNAKKSLFDDNGDSGDNGGAGQQLVLSAEPSFDVRTMAGFPHVSVQSRRVRTIHVLAKKSRGKIRNKFNALFAASGKEKVFATLTFIQRISDSAAVKVLNKFFTSLRKKFDNLHYIWVAERQHDNKKFPGNIHFHVMLNKYLPIEYFNALWVRQQYNSGLVGFTKKYGNRFVLPAEIDAMDDKKVQRYFNPLDVEKIHSPHALAAYLTNYVTKNNDQFECLAWHCSRGVSKLFIRTVISRDLFLQISDPEINYTDGLDKETGEIIRYKGKVFPLKANPFVVMGYILNKKYFGQKMNVVNQINKWILSENFKPDIPILTDAEYMSRYHNQGCN